ncbi:proliferating cell nuclear antigen (pcna) [Candidatus Hecatella orcuttiae]|jgi:proliferating cell nuclear antigen|uniref:proliferating cell nuclear antigen (pcna) n=1 Tax=Candidatus Hecatella orcuttiae TaxID=1935119 RepID=UPI002867DB2C|nr:proliferating cell nuclear antigen (pcna) [Candidatus Hecatella orcuttiae]
MFRLVISDSRAWKNLMAAISTLVEEASFDVKPEGLALRAMDPSHVAMVDFEYPKESFQEYECTEPSKLCLDIGDMLKLMRRVEAGETLELTLDPQTNHLNMKLTGKYKRRFSLPLLQPSVSEVPTPKLTFDAQIKMDADCLNDAITDISNVSDQVKIEADEEKLVLTGLSETGNVVVEFERANQAVLDFQVKGEAKALYGVSFLQDMVKAGAASSKVVSVEFSTDKPVKIDFELPLQGKLTYYLAPRLE